MIIITGTIELLLMRYSNGYSFKKRYLNEHSDSIEVLLLGGSHTENQINPHLFKKNTFNAACQGRYLYYDYKIAEQNLPHMKNLKDIVLTISSLVIFRSMSYDASNNMADELKDGYRCMYLKYMGIHYGKFDWQYWPELVNSKLDFMKRILAKSDKERNACDMKGYAKLPIKHIKGWENNQIPAFVDYSEENVLKAYHENLIYIKNLAYLCKRQGVKLILVQMPYYKTARTKVTNKDIKMLESFVDSVKTINKDVAFLNYLDDNRFDSTDFYNSNHLNSQGADKVTQLIMKEIEN